jgi:hypothetical protein
LRRVQADALPKASLPLSQRNAHLQQPPACALGCSSESVSTSFRSSSICSQCAQAEARAHACERRLQPRILRASHSLERLLIEPFLDQSINKLVDRSIKFWFLSPHTKRHAAWTAVLNLKRGEQ